LAITNSFFGGVGGEQKSKSLFARHLMCVSFGIFVIALGILRLEVSSWSEITPSLEERVGQRITLTGVVVREPDVRESTTHLYVKTKEDLILAIVDRYDGEFDYGDRVKVTEVLEKPEAFETDLGRTFNYPGYLLARGVSYTLPFAEVEVLERSKGNPAMSAIFSAKHFFMRQIEILLPEPQAGLSEGLLLGVKRALGEELEKVFRQTGIIHIVVLSGYNVMIVVTFVMYILGAIFGRRLSTGFGVVAVALFAFTVGLSATVMRASIMACLLLVVGLTGRIYFALRGLLLAGLIMLLINPYLLVYDVGFQLSFVATLGLILASTQVSSLLSKIPTWFGVREFLTATLVTQIFVLPLLLYQIGEFSLVAVVVNVLVLPMVPLAMLLTFITGIVSMLSLNLALSFSYLTHLSLTYIILVAEWFATLPFASFVVPAFPFWLVPIAYMLIAYAVWHWFYRREDRLAYLDEWQIIEESEIKEVAATPHFFR